jgi:two-component system, NarL family, nitrate/nitrite response regulator NarL
VERYRVLVVDDHPLFRDAMARLLRSWAEVEVIGEAASGRAALERIRADPPDVAVVDVRMPDVDGVQLCAAVGRDGLATRILIVSGYDDDELVYAALEAGAAGYVPKDAPRDEMARAVLAVAHGEMAIAPRLASGLASQIRIRRERTGPLLTDREREVLALLAEGKSAPEIGRMLFLATSTVKSHLAHLYEKLGVSDRAAAVAEAMRRGLIE